MRTADITGKVELPEEVKMVMPGDNVTAVFELISPVPLEAGMWNSCLIFAIHCDFHCSWELGIWFLNELINLCLIGQRFALREGGRTVGAGVVSKVFSWGEPRFSKFQFVKANPGFWNAKCGNYFYSLHVYFWCLCRALFVAIGSGVIKWTRRKLSWNVTLIAKLRYLHMILLF